MLQPRARKDVFLRVLRTDLRSFVLALSLARARSLAPLRARACASICRPQPQIPSTSARLVQKVYTLTAWAQLKMPFCRSQARISKACSARTSAHCAPRLNKHARSQHLEALAAIAASTTPPRRAALALPAVPACRAGPPASPAPKTPSLPHQHTPTHPTNKQTDKQASKQ